MPANNRRDSSGSKTNLSLASRPENRRLRAVFVLDRHFFIAKLPQNPSRLARVYSTQRLGDSQWSNYLSGFVSFVVNIFAFINNHLSAFIGTKVAEKVDNSPDISVCRQFWPGILGRR